MEDIRGRREEAENWDRARAEDWERASESITQTDEALRRAKEGGSRDVAQISEFGAECGAAVG